MKVDYELLRKQIKIDLTPMQNLILDYYRGFREAHGRNPKMREVMVSFGYKNVSSVQRHVEPLRDGGFLPLSPRNKQAPTNAGGEKENNE